MDLYTLIITLDVPGQMNVIRLVYNNLDTAAATHAALIEPTPLFRAVSDDYGKQVAVLPSRIVAVQLSPLAREFESEADIAILQGHAQNKLQRRAAADPMLKPIHPANGPLPFMPQGRG